MKIYNVILILILAFLSSNLSAQSVDSTQTSQKEKELVIPKFHGGMLVLRTLEFAGLFDAKLTISDGGGESFSLDLKHLSNNNELDYTRKLASVLIQLREQGYRLITSNSGASGDSNWTMLATAYVFQKE